jgi:hypothetical protein
MTHLISMYPFDGWRVGKLKYCVVEIASSKPTILPPPTAAPRAAYAFSRDPAGEKTRLFLPPPPVTSGSATCNPSPGTDVSNSAVAANDVLQPQADHVDALPLRGPWQPAAELPPPA